MWGECWEIKDQIGEKKTFQGARNFRGGTFWGNAKKGWKNFFGGVLGSCEPQQILGARNFGGHFWGKCKKRVWGGVLGEL